MPVHVELTWLEDINISSVPNEDDDKLLHYMIVIPAPDFINVHKKMYNTKGDTELISKPAIWINKLEQLIVEVDKSDEWFTTLGYTGLKISNIKRAQKVFLANRSYLTAMGVDSKYKPKLSRALTKTEMEQQQMENKTTDGGKDEGEQKKNVNK